MENRKMNDKEIIIKTIKYLKSINGFVVITVFWDELSLNDERKNHIRDLLLLNELISWNDDNHWMFKLTAKGSVAKSSDLKNNGLLKNKVERIQIITWVLTIFSVLLGATLNNYLQKEQKDNEPKTIILPPIQLIHDTIYKILPATKK